MHVYTHQVGMHDGAPIGHLEPGFVLVLGAGLCPLRIGNQHRLEGHLYTTQPTAVHGASAAAANQLGHSQNTATRDVQRGCNLPNLVNVVVGHSSLAWPLV